MLQASDPQLLLVAADDHAPALARGASLERAARHATSPVSSASHLWSESERPDDLGAQRWAVLAPEGREGDALLEALAPLIARRSAEQGAPARVYRLPPELDAAAAARWKKQVFWTSERLLQHLPRYHLLLGDLHQISPETHTILASDGFTGRLAFDRAEDYAAYAAKVLASERAPPSRTPRAVFHTVHDGTTATAVGHRALMAPGLALTQAALPGATLVTSGGELPAPGQLLQVARGAEPTVLLSLSHGEGAPRGGWRDASAQRARQGAMSFGGEGRLTAEDLAGAEFLPHGLWFMFACFGAGTPRESKFRPWLEELAARGQYQGDPAVVLRSLPPAGAPPFVAALPKAALASPRGPLAFIGHVDLAWTYSFRDLDAGPTNRAARFVQALTSLLRGHRVGVAFRELFRFFEQTNTELTTLGESSTRDAVRRAHLWMLRQDLAGFVVLGDPAARLPLVENAPASVAAGPEVAGRTPPAAAVTSEAGPPEPAGPAAFSAEGRADPAAFFPGMTVLPPTRPAASAERLERAIAQVILDARALPGAAQQVGLAAAALADLVERYRRGGRAAIGKG